MRIYDIIEKKRDGYTLTKEEISFFVNEYTNENIMDYQASALIMAIFINGMSEEETVFLTEAMAKSGDILDLSEIDGITADKHSTGGVGDKTSLIVAPICASLGIKMAKMSGKGLGHTGGTIDKLESIDKYNVNISSDNFIKQVNNIGIAIIGQTGNLAPADKKIYALRDVTATVDSIPLIASSIMSKKIAAGAKNIILDVKCGNGAFMKDISSATRLADLMVKIGKQCNRNTIAEITNMNIPLGTHIGNALEIKESIEILNNRGDKDLRQLCLSLAANILCASYRYDYDYSFKCAEEVLVNGKAFEKFKELIIAQGGNIKQIEEPDLLPKSKYSYEIKSPVSGYIEKMNSKIIGECCVILGAGREKIDDKINYGAGIILNKKTYDFVQKDDLLATIFTDKENVINQVENLFLNSIIFSSNKPNVEPLIYKVIK